MVSNRRAVVDNSRAASEGTRQGEQGQGGEQKLQAEKLQRSRKQALEEFTKLGKSIGPRA